MSLSREEKERLERQEKHQHRSEFMQKDFHFADRLCAAMKKKNSVVCVGLDPRLSQIPEFIKSKHLGEVNNKMTAAANAILEFNKGIIDAVSDIVPAIKPQIAFYEQYGSDGVRAFEETIWYAQEKGLLTIADIKRSDIGSTTEAYANAFTGKVELFDEEVFVFDADAVTLNAYLGWDGVKPFTESCKKFGKGAFILVKTSNQSSMDIQDLKMEDGSTVYEIMAHYVESWGADDLGECGYSFLGAVVGATFPKQAKKLREVMPDSIFLVPGYGAQGGTAQDVKACFKEDGTGAIVNSSRGIIYAWEESDTFTEKDYAQAARDAAVKMNNDINSVLQ
jgi:orotidine-5'-phosphate decarboxylase